MRASTYFAKINAFNFDITVAGRCTAPGNGVDVPMAQKKPAPHEAGYIYLFRLPYTLLPLINLNKIAITAITNRM
jgi:hypothetical protein